MGSALTSKSAPRTRQRMRTRPARTRYQRALASSGISIIHFRRTGGTWAVSDRSASRMCNWDFSTEAEKWGHHGLWLLPLQRPLHDVPDSVLGRLARMQNGVHLFRDGHFDLMFAGQRHQRRGSIHALGNHAHIREDFAQGPPFAELHSHKAIAAERACASENQVAQSCQTAER